MFRKAATPGPLTRSGSGDFYDVEEVTMKKTFKSEELRDLLDGNSETLEEVENRITGSGRWSKHYALVFKETATGTFYQTAYSVGATEQQDEGPFEHTDTVTCDEVRPVEKVVIAYEKVTP